MGSMITGISNKDSGRKLRYLVVDQKALQQHKHMSQALKSFLKEQQELFVVDISAGQKKFSAAESLCLADCQEMVDFARDRDMAVLGYEKPGDVHRITEMLPMVVEDFDEVDYDFLLRVYQRYHHLPWTVLTTRRCILREMAVDDLDALYELYAPAEITRYMEGLHEKKEDEEAYIRAYISHMYEFYGYGMWVVTEKSDGKLMGRAGLSHLEVDGEVQLELGYVIAREYQRQGYGYEVCQAILEYVKEELFFESIHCLIRPGNLSSVGLAEKLGFVYDKNVLCNGKEMQRYSKILHFS